MNVADQTFNIELSAFHVSVLRQFRSLSPNVNMSAIMRPFFSSSFTFYNSAATALRLNWAIGGDQLRKIIYIDGCSLSSHAVNLIDGYNNGFGPTGTDGFNQWAQDSALAILSYTESNAVFQPENLDVVGYSAGAVVASYLVRELKRRGTLKKLRITTLGAPRAMSAPNLPVWSSVPETRWMCDNDPIPLVPPRIEDAPVLVPLLGLLTTLRYSSYVHAGGGLSINAASVITDSVLPTAAAMSPGTSLATWYFGQEDDPASGHGLTQYQNRFAALLALPSHGAGAGNAGSGQEPGATTNRRQITRSEAVVVNQVAAASERQNATPTAVSATVLFKAVKLGKIWSVAFGPSIIVYAGNRKRAFHLARAGNDFLKSMPKQAFVDPENILAEMTNFFNAAVQVGGPVSPPISTSL
jgi:hypothetical protein